MNYREQLNQPEWLAKRERIIKRDFSSCINCKNETYTTLSKGIILGNDIMYKNTLQNKYKYQNSIHIFDLENNIIKRVYTNSSNFDIRNNYIGFYQESDVHTRVIALKSIQDSDIEVTDGSYTTLSLCLENSLFFKLLSINLKKIFSEKTYDSVYSGNINRGYWHFITGLQVHHNYYKVGSLAWEYPDESLSTLCWLCHEIKHKEGITPVLDVYGNNIANYTNCKKCHGLGYISKYDYYQNGVCFRCNGERWEELINRR
ncbi:hypothetical protein GVN16_03355 [Emticicia sp. CRIBPO]|uniref:hypothetical protein n=1 Tax=Emticicia sp. CRIBPO TaxID=2683258 RepID=UPI0014136275|nr:hypothetical protein [Emticicia sp. CRIBPO]NBA84777.1 hypothetical protein [Emticicia sp. CRIBPO]